MELTRYSSWINNVPAKQEFGGVWEMHQKNTGRVNATIGKGDSSVEAATPGPTVSALVDGGQEFGLVADQGKHEQNPSGRWIEFPNR